MISEKRNSDYLSRLVWLLHGRDKHPWGRRIGLKNTRIHSMFQGTVPGADALEHLHAAEAVNLHWLLTGQGPPYYVSATTDAEAAEAVRHNLAPLALLVAPNGAAGILTGTRPAEGGGALPAVNVLGVVGPRTLEALGPRRRVRLVEITPADLAAVRAGERGAYQVLGEDPGAWPSMGAGELDRIAERPALYAQTEIPAEFRPLYLRLTPRARDALMVLLAECAG